MNALYRFFKSVKLAVALLLTIAVLSILSTLIPQGQEQAYYFHRYAPFLAWLIATLRFDAFFKSLLFLIPCVLFFANLSVCSVDRLVGRWRRKARRRHGPDLIHVGLLVLIIGALLSTWGRRELVVFLGQGDERDLPMGYRIKLLSYVYEQYPDGRPKDWISTVEVSRQSRGLVASYPIEVNRPLRLAGMKIYQTTFARQDTALLRDRQGELATIESGQGFTWQDALMVFAGIENKAAVFERWEGHTRTAVIPVALLQTIGEYTVVELSSRDLTGLKAVRDPGFIVVIVALILAAAGLALTFLQKRGDKEI